MVCQDVSLIFYTLWVIWDTAGLQKPRKSTPPPSSVLVLKCFLTHSIMEKTRNTNTSIHLLLLVTFWHTPISHPLLKTLWVFVSSRPYPTRLIFPSIHLMNLLYILLIILLLLPLLRSIINMHCALIIDSCNSLTWILPYISILSFKKFLPINHYTLFSPHIIPKPSKLLVIIISMSIPPTSLSHSTMII